MRAIDSIIVAFSEILKWHTLKYILITVVSFASFMVYI